MAVTASLCTTPSENLFASLARRARHWGNSKNITQIDVSLRDTLAIFDEGLQRIVFYDPQLNPVSAVRLSEKFSRFVALPIGRNWNNRLAF